MKKCASHWWNLSCTSQFINFILCTCRRVAHLLQKCIHCGFFLDSLASELACNTAFSQFWSEWYFEFSILVKLYQMNFEILLRSPWNFRNCQIWNFNCTSLVLLLYFTIISCSGQSCHCRTIFRCRGKTVQCSLPVKISVSRAIFLTRTVISFISEVRYMLSPVRLSSVICLWRSCTLLRRLKFFVNFSAPFGTVAISWHPGKILRRSSQGNASVRGVEHKRGSRI